MEEETKHFDEDEDKEQSMLALLIHSARRTFRENLPLDIIKQLRGRYLVVLGCIGYGITFSLFIMFFVVGFLQRSNETYISTDPNAGDCVEVGRALTGTFLASTSGVWEGSQDFKYHEALYSFRFTDLIVTSDEFRTMITKDFNLSPLKNFMVMHDMPSNLIAYTNFVDSVVVKGKAQTMTLAISPNEVFNRNYRSGYAYNINATYCYADGILYDGASTSYVFLFGKKANNQNCVHLTNYVVNYQSKMVSNFGIFRMDLNTFAAAMAVNLKLLTLAQFEIVEDMGIFDLGGMQLQATRVHNPRFPKMSPVACVVALNVNVTWSPYCSIVQNDKSFLPALYHYKKACRGCSNARATVQSYMDKIGAGDSSQVPRQQGSYAESAPSDGDADCNIIDLVAALVYVPIEPLTASYGELLKLIVTFNAVEINDIVAESAAQTNASKVLFQICPLCTVLSVNLYDNSLIIGQYGQTLKNGHCAQSYNSSNFYKLGDTPPQQLVENYFECTDTAFGSFFYAIGFAFGNTGTFAPLILVTLVPVIFFLLGCWGSKVPFEPYSEEMTEDATKELVRLLLKIKDGKMQNIPPGGVLESFVDEVKQAHKNIERRRSLSVGKRTPRKKKFLLSSPASMDDINAPPTPVYGQGIVELDKEQNEELNTQETIETDKRGASGTALISGAEVLPDSDHEGSEEIELGGDIEAFDSHFDAVYGGRFATAKHYGRLSNSLVEDAYESDEGSENNNDEERRQEVEPSAYLPVPFNRSRDVDEEDGETTSPGTPLAIRSVKVELGEEL